MQVIHKSIGQMFSEVTERFPDKEALVHSPSGTTWTFSQLLNEIDKAAAGMLACGFQPGDKIALWTSNLAEWMVAFIALAKMGAVVIPVDPSATRDNLHYILDQSQSRGLILSVDENGSEPVEWASNLKDELSGLDTIVAIGESLPEGMISWSEIRMRGESHDALHLAQTARAVNPEDPVSIMYTSGTTGSPKGVVLDHLGLINKSMHSTNRQGITDKDRLCLFFPLFHMFGNTCIALAGLIRGAALIMPCTNFDPDLILDTIPGQSCSAVYGSPSMLIALLDHPNFNAMDWVTVKKGIIGGAPCPMELMKRIVTDIGVSDITVAWGITETASWITMTRPDDPIELRVSTIGTPLECSEVKIVDPRSGQSLAATEQGELCTRGFLMSSYYRMPGATTAAIDRDGWFHTGDLGTMDEKGYVRITGRLKDVIVRDGLDIYPIELEEIIYELSDVSEAQVFGFEHETRGQEVAAWVKIKEGADLTLSEIAEHVGQRLPPQQHPAHYKFVDAFPMTGSGKVQKFKMAELAAKEYGKGK